MIDKMFLMRWDHLNSQLNDYIDLFFFTNLKPPTFYLLHFVALIGQNEVGWIF